MDKKDTLEFVSKMVEDLDRWAEVRSKFAASELPEHRKDEVKHAFLATKGWEDYAKEHADDQADLLQSLYNSAKVEIQAMAVCGVMDTSANLPDMVRNILNDTATKQEIALAAVGIGGAHYPEIFGTTDKQHDDRHGIWMSCDWPSTPICNAMFLIGYVNYS